jgi:hypothetical protein
MALNESRGFSTLFNLAKDRHYHSNIYGVVEHRTGKLVRKNFEGKRVDID